jgi:transcriptional regulator with XRE-family HTH domain
MLHPLRQYRYSHTPPLTQGELARRCQVAPNTISRWENHARRIDQHSLKRVSRVTGIDPAILRPDLATLLGWK